jgi:hypothetical protein
MIVVEHRGGIQAGELVQHVHRMLGLATPPYADHQAHAAVLIDHVQEFQPPAIGGGVELQDHGLDLVRVFGLVRPDGVISGPCSLRLERRGLSDDNLVEGRFASIICYPF